MNDVSQPADLPLPEATPDAAARSDAIDAIVRVLEADRPVPWRVIAADVYDAVADSLRAQGAAAERDKWYTAVAGLHTRFAIYDECDHEHEEDDPAAIDCDGFVTCADAYEYTICVACCTHNEQQTEDCASWHAHGHGLVRCPTVGLVAELGGAEARAGLLAGDAP